MAKNPMTKMISTSLKNFRRPAESERYRVHSDVGQRVINYGRRSYLWLFYVVMQWLVVLVSRYNTPCNMCSWTCVMKDNSITVKFLKQWNIRRKFFINNLRGSSWFYFPMGDSTLKVTRYSFDNFFKIRTLYNQLCF